MSSREISLPAHRIAGLYEQLLSAVEFGNYELDYDGCDTGAFNNKTAEFILRIQDWLKEKGEDYSMPAIVDFVEDGLHKLLDPCRVKDHHQAVSYSRGQTACQLEVAYIVRDYGSEFNGFPLAGTLYLKFGTFTSGGIWQIDLHD